MRLRLLTHLVPLLPLLLHAGEPWVTVDMRNVLSNRFMGLGVQIDPYEYPPSPAAWRLTLQRLDHMHPSFFRVMWRANPYCLGFDTDGNPQYVWSSGEPAVESRLAPLFKILDYAQSRNIDVMLGEWDPPKGLLSGSPIAGPQDPRWARIITDFVNYLNTRRKYTVIKYYNFMNEPNGNWMWPGGKVDFEAWAEGMRHLRREFDRNGLRSLPIAGPDNSGNWDWIDRSARNLSPQIGLWDMHWYVKDQELFHGDIEMLLNAKREMLLKTDPGAASKGMYMAEAGVIEGRVNGDQQPRVKDFVYGVLMADYVAQVARAGWLGAAAWDLDDAMHVVNGREHPVVPNDLTLKIWGFWNTQGSNMGHPEDEALRPWFYTWSLMSRLFPKGACILDAQADALPAGIRVMASTWQAATREQLAVMVVNDAPDDSAAAHKITLRVPHKGKQSLFSYHYFANHRPVDRDGFPVPMTILKDADLEHGIDVDLPSRGVLFLTTSPLP